MFTKSRIRQRHQRVTQRQVAPPPGGNAKYVSTTGTGTGDGSIGDPWTLTQALRSTGGAQPGDTVYLRSGTYNMDATLNVNCAGTAIAPIWFQSYPGEWAVIQGTLNNTDQSLFINDSAHVSFRDLRLTMVWTATGPTARYLPGSVVNRVPTRGEARFSGTECHTVNLLIDNSSGITGHGGQGNMLFYGNVAWNNGLLDDVRSHGHVYYANNTASGQRTVRHNIASYQFGNAYSIRSLGSEVKNFLVKENTVIAVASQTQSAGLACYECYGDISFGGAQVLSRGNRFFNRPTTTSPGRIGASAYALLTYGSSVDYFDADDDWVVTGGEIRASIPTTLLRIKNTTLWNRNPAGATTRHEFISCELNAQGNPDVTTYDASNNKFYGSPRSNPFTWRGLRYTFSGWQAITGQDANSTHSTAGIPPDRQWLDKNLYETGRANITIYNGNALASTVTVNVDTVLNNGEAWWLYNAGDPTAGAIASGTYTTGAGINVPMTSAVAGSPPTPGGADGTWIAAVPSQLPDFGAFVLRRVGPTWVAPPANLALPVP